MNRQISAQPLARTKTRRSEWIYQDRLPLRTGTILAGQGGIAKSTIISDIVARATRGDLPGTFAGKPIAVGIISPEDDTESILVPRLMAAGANLENVASLSVTVTDGARSWSTLPNIADDLPALGETIREHGIRLLIVDPLISIMSGNSISQSDVRRNFDPLSALAKEHDFALLAVAHFGKSGERAGDRVSGSHAFRDIARVVIVAAIDEETGDRVLTVEKSNYSRVHPSDAYAIESVRVLLDDGEYQEVGRASLRGESTVTVQDILDRDRDTSSLSSDMRLVIATVESHPDGVGAETVAAELGMDEAKARTYLNRAEKRGDIGRLSRGTFAPLLRVKSVMSVSKPETLDTQITDFITGHLCIGCGNPLAAPLVAAGRTSHPDPVCEVAA